MAKKYKKFVSRIELQIYSFLTALEIGKHLKIGVWHEDTGDYSESAKSLSNVLVSRLDIQLQVSSAQLPQEYSVEIDFTFQSEKNEKYLQEKVVLFFGENSASLKHANEDYDLIETADYSFFELSEET